MEFNKISIEQIVGVAVVLAMAYILFFQGNVNNIFSAFAPEEKELIGFEPEIPSKINKVQPSEGFAFIELEKGTGDLVSIGDSIFVDYVGTLESGTIFSTSKNAQPFNFIVGSEGIIPGFSASVVGMRVGGVRIARIPPELGYGDQVLPLIPPSSTLYFRIELIQINVPQ